MRERYSNKRSLVVRLLAGEESTSTLPLYEIGGFMLEVVGAEVVK